MIKTNDAYKPRKIKRYLTGDKAITLQRFFDEALPRVLQMPQARPRMDWFHPTINIFGIKREVTGYGKTWVEEVTMPPLCAVCYYYTGHEFVWKSWHKDAAAFIGMDPYTDGGDLVNAAYGRSINPRICAMRILMLDMFGMEERVSAPLHPLHKTDAWRGPMPPGQKNGFNVPGWKPSIQDVIASRAILHL